MRLLTKAGLGLGILFVAIAVAPAAKADPIGLSTSGFSLSNLGNNGDGVSGLDSLVGTAVSSSHNAGRFTALLNPLTFTTGFAGNGSPDSYSFNFSEPLTINGTTQTLNLVGSITIRPDVDSIHILSAAPLTFNFNTLSVDVAVLPRDIDGSGPGVFSDILRAEFTVRSDCNPVPEPATLTLLGIGLAGVAAQLRRKSLKV